MADKDFLTTIKANPLISTLLAISFMAATVTGGIASFGQLDRLVVTHAEHEHFLAEHQAGWHEAAREAITDLQRWNRCDRLERRLERLDDRMWKIEQQEVVNRVELRNASIDTSKTKRQFDALDCARVLTK